MASIPALIRFSFILSTLALVACRESEEQCSQPFVVGECDAAMPVYWHNSATGECELRTYGGCGGNDNRFTTLEDCQSTCDAGSMAPGDGDGGTGGDGDGDGDGDGGTGGDGGAQGDGDGDATDPESCQVGSETYESGAEFTSDCNTCSCLDGVVICTRLACQEPETQCSLPFVGGECDAAISVYWHNSATGECEPRTYGGCGGNDNRFTTLEDCQSTCDAAASGPSCEVGGVVYPDGSTNVPDPGSCNTCTCSAGEVTGCTKIHCPSECEEGSIYGTDCANCGPVDECLIVRTGCLPTCKAEEDCEESGGYCIEGACRNICG